jgi:glycosyltransferase involved in cell wall biosynthesis
MSQIKQQIININPDYIYLNHLYSPFFVIYPLWLKLVDIIKCKVIVCPRGALYESAISVKAYKKRPLLFIYYLIGVHQKIIFHATNLREQRAIDKYFPCAKTIVVDNLPSFNQHEYVSITKNVGELKCVFISRIVPIKNLLFLLDFIQDVKSQIKLTIAGPVEDDNYWNLCEKKIKQLPLNINVEYIGSLKNADIADLIQSNHLFILPTKGENFGHSIFESFLSGRPVLISDQTPWLHLSDLYIGWDLPLSQPEEFTKIIEKMAGFNQNEFELFARGAWNYASDFCEKSLQQNKYFNLFS